MSPALHRFIAGFFRRTWVCVGVVATMCAGFAAHAASSVTGEILLGDPASPHRSAASPAAPVAQTPKLQRPDSSTFVARNMFCATCDEVIKDPGPTELTSSATPTVLIATSIGAESRATVRVVPTEVQGSFGIGEEIPLVGTIVSISPQEVEVVDTQDKHATIKFAVNEPPKPPDKDKVAATTPSNPFADRVKQLDDHTWEADRSLFKELMGGMSKPGGVRAMPVVVKGEVQGIRLSSIKADSLPGAFGLKNGDTLVAIDGDPIKNANQVLDLMVKIDSASGFQLSGTRGGKPLELTLKLR